MNKKLTLICSLILITTTTFLSAVSEDGSIISDTRTLKNSNIEFVENGFYKKIEKEQSKLEKYKANLEKSENESEVNHWLRKTKSSEKKIKNLNEALLGIELVKSRVND